MTTNGTTTTSTVPPIAAAQTQPLDISKIPRCIQNAMCKTGSPSGNGTSSFHQKVDYDPRLGVCKCEDGYERTSKDICVKIVKRNGAPEKTVAGAVILAALAFNKMFAF